MDFTTVKPYSAQTDIRHSTFIAIVERVQSEEQLFAVLKDIRKQYSDATHICYAAIFDKTGNAARFSDDGEPGGTAGAPILEAIKGAGLRETLVAVVRYFGGIKLGAGGLVRAYSSSASDALKAAEKIDMKMTDFYRLKMDFSTAKKATGALARKGYAVVSTEYSDCVTLTLAVPSGAQITADIANILGARPDLSYEKTDYLPVVR